MTGSMFQLFSPEAQNFCGVAAGVVGVIGLFVWSAGIRLARPVTAVAFGVATAGVASWGLPQVTSLAPVSAAIIGFVVGVLFGAVTFRFLQAFFVAGMLALIVGGVYYRTNIYPQRMNAYSKPAEVASATLPAKEMLIKTERLQASPDAAKNGKLDAAVVADAARTAAENAKRVAQHEWDSLGQAQRQRLAVLAALAVIAGIMIGLFFPKGTTWVATAATGTLVISGAALVLLQIYGTQYLNVVPTQPAVVLGILGGVTLIGMILQRTVFWPGAKNSKPRPEPRPVPGTLPGEPAAA